MHFWTLLRHSFEPFFRGHFCAAFLKLLGHSCATCLQDTLRGLVFRFFGNGKLFQGHFWESSGRGPCEDTPSAATLVGHCCATNFFALVWHTRLTLLYDTALVGHSCSTLLRETDYTFAGHSCKAAESVFVQSNIYIYIHILYGCSK